MATHDDARPTPEELLERYDLRSEPEESGRGKLRVILGAAPGVGKTYHMLIEGRRLSADGEDVVVGYVETHGRIETEAQLGALEIVPRQQIDYQGKLLEEMDVDAIIARESRHRPDRRAGAYKRAGLPQCETLDGCRRDP